MPSGNSQLVTAEITNSTFVGPKVHAVPSIGLEAVVLGGSLSNCSFVGQASGQRCPLAYRAQLDHCTVFGFGTGGNPLFDDAIVDRCTIMQTRSAPNSLLDGAGTTTRLMNSIVDGHIGPITDVMGNTFVSYSRTPGPLPPGPGNIIADARLYAPLSGDARLGSGSPAIDAGDPAQLDSDGMRLDMGAFPRLPSQAAPEALAFCDGLRTSELCVPTITSTSTAQTRAGHSA